MAVSPGQQPAAGLVVRGRCACGRRYRIRNALPDVTVQCPNCGRAIQISIQDLRAALLEQALIPLQDTLGEAKEAILIDHGELTLAPEGSRPGLTGRLAFDHEETMLHNAIRGWVVAGGTRDLTPEVRANRMFARVTLVRRTFVGDLLASFYFAGIGRNALNILLTAIGCAAPVLAFFFLPGVLRIAALFVAGLVLLYMVQFYWSLLRLTAGGEDEIPWVPEDFEFWEDIFKPVAFLIAISVLCMTPEILAAIYFPGILRANPLAWLGLAALGTLLWPVAVMSVALGNSWLFLRPDWLIRCMVAIGPAYLIAWAAVAVSATSAVLFFIFAQVVDQILGIYSLWASLLAGAPIAVLGFALNLYFFYVVFRTLGLLYRHFRQRFPWKY